MEVLIALWSVVLFNCAGTHRPGLIRLSLSVHCCLEFLCVSK